MDINSAVGQVTDLVKPLIEAEGMELVEVEFVRSRGGRILRIFIDKPGGVTIEDCAQVSHRVGDVLDMEDPIAESYTLEVSSPGLDRQLKSEADYRRYSGRKIRVITTTGIDGKNVHIGRLMEFNGDTLKVDVDGKAANIPLRLVSKARLEPEF